MAKDYEGKETQLYLLKIVTLKVVKSYYTVLKFIVSYSKFI